VHQKCFSIDSYFPNLSKIVGFYLAKGKKMFYLSVTKNYGDDWRNE